MTAGEPTYSHDGSVLDGLYAAIAEEAGVSFSKVKHALYHRVFPEDYFYDAMDRAISEGRQLYERVAT